MTLLEAIQDPIFDLPLTTKKYFPEFLNESFSKYLELLSLVDDEYKEIIDQYFENIKLNCEKFKQVIQHVYMGNTAKAYNILKIEIEKLDEYLTKRNKNAQDEIPYNLFRARSNQNEQLGINDMFHVPFEKRHLIHTSRFGLPGLPCLYLCNNIYTCWEEMGRPPFAYMPVSRFEITGTVFNFLDLIPFVNEVKSHLTHKMPDLVSYFKDLLLPKFFNIYPIFLACYIKGLNSNAIYKPEYIFPQLLMQWVGENDGLDGIKYISTKCKPTPRSYHNLKAFINFAIPIKSFSEKGFCSVLSKNISLTEPITWELFNILNPSKASSELNFREDIMTKFHVEIINFSLVEGRMDKYHKTQFGILEHELLGTPLKKITPQ